LLAYIIRKVPAEGNLGRGPSQAETMDFLHAQKLLAGILKSVDERVDQYFWRLTGKEPNSLCILLGIEEESLKVILRACKIYIGDADNVSKRSLELLMDQAGLDFTTFRMKGIFDRFIKLGKKGDLVLPKGMYGSSNGELTHYPVHGQHILSMRTKSQREAIGELLALCKKGTRSDESTPKETARMDDGNGNKNKEKLDSGKVSPQSFLLSYIQDLVKTASKTGDGKMSRRTQRQLQRMMTTCIDHAAKDLLHDVLAKFTAKHAVENNGEEFMSPKANKLNAKMATASIVTPSDCSTVMTGPPSVVMTSAVSESGFDEDETLQDEDDVSVSTKAAADEVMSEIKQESLLQSLLYERIHERKERVFQLQHRNGRRLLVVLPPDTLSITAFEEEATKSNWVKVMLNTPERVEGMLMYLAKYETASYLKIGKQRKLSMKTVSLTTAQTMALARIGALNDDRMGKVRSYLRTIGKVHLQLSKGVQRKIDLDVGLERTQEATFGSYIHEWTASKKAPEEVQYWNCSLSKEIEAEIDMYLQHVLATSTGIGPFPTLDYDAPGFGERGITILFGGDHGNGSCPISCKLNLCSPSERKQKGLLGYHCPLIPFASVKCSKDSYELMNNTVMPTVKQQLLQLKKSCVITIYHRGESSTVFRSHVVPSTIDMDTVAFVRNGVTKMTFAFGNNKDEPKFGSVVVDDEELAAVPYFHLRAKLVVSTFNELFIGDLAFLAMLVGMNNSSGSHCLLCMHKASNFNCPHTSLEPRTKGKLEECLAEYMTKTQTMATPPPNYRGVNGPGLWDIDPQRVIVPILHCPMGLVDKVLETMKLWINLDIEDLKDDESNTIREEYKDAQDRRIATTEAHNHALAVVATHPTPEARQLVKQTNEARKKAKQEEAAKKVLYSEMIQTHNAKKTSLTQQFEAVYRKNGITREHYHGGKFNGVNCIRIMEQSAPLLLGNEDNEQGFLQLCIKSKLANVDDAVLESKMKDYCRLLGILDAIWSSVRGIDSGLLPTQQQLDSLKTSLQEGKALWLEMKLSTLQPKWHLTFDGHLYYQVSRFGGLADKSDESIEKLHQTFKALYDRYRRISSYERRETCIRRELRRGRSPEVQQHITAYEEAIKQSAGSKRALDTADRTANKKLAKVEKRAAYAVGTAAPAVGDQQ
jgi:hypothetical protein